MVYEGEQHISYPSKTYCQFIESLFAERQIALAGNCYYFGYEVEAETQENGWTICWHFLRHQTTQNGIIIPRNANEYAELKISIRGIDPQWNYTTRRFLKCIFGFKQSVPAEMKEQINRFVTFHKLKKLELKYGELRCVLIGEQQDPIALKDALLLLIPRE